MLILYQINSIKISPHKIKIKTFYKQAISQPFLEIKLTETTERSKCSMNNPCFGEEVSIFMFIGYKLTNSIRNALVVPHKK